MKSMPLDDNGKPYAIGSENKTFWAEIQTGEDLYKTTTGWDPVTLPDGVEVKQCVIQVRSFDDATALSEDAIPFLFSSESDGSGSIACKAAFQPGAAKVSGILGYVYTGVADRKIAVVGLS